MIQLIKEVKYVGYIDNNKQFVLVADIGGTNSNFGLFYKSDLKNELLLSLHYKSSEIDYFANFIKEVIEYLYESLKLKIDFLCIGAAGIVYRDKNYVKPTNLNFSINLDSIKRVTYLRNLLLINDFEAVSLGYELIEPNKIIPINKGITVAKGNKGFLGAGTGLGKSLLVWQKKINKYMPVASEGGHMDVSVYHEEEFDFIKFVHNTYGFCPVSWEDVLSGNGIQRIYEFWSKKKIYPLTDITKEIEKSDFDPDKISFYAQQDEQAKDTFDFYLKFYARCAKNFALDTLALNGIYIAGGIAAKNISMFLNPEFMEEFKQCSKHRDTLENVPVYIISDYNVSLYGCYKAFELYEQGLL